MRNDLLQKLLARMPAECNVRIRLPNGVEVNVEHCEFGMTTTPQTINEANVSWMDIVKETIRVILVPAPMTGTPLDDPIAKG